MGKQLSFGNSPNAKGIVCIFGVVSSCVFGASSSCADSSYW